MPFYKSNIDCVECIIQQSHVKRETLRSMSKVQGGAALQGSGEGYLWGEVGQLGDCPIPVVCAGGPGHHIHCYCRPEPPGLPAASHRNQEYCLDLTSNDTHLTALTS